MMMALYYPMKKFTFLTFACFIFFAACKKPGHGGLTVSLKDGPADYQEINVEIENIEIYLDGASKGWYKLNTNKGIYNILLFQSTSALLASNNHIPAGKTSQMRITFGEHNSIKENDNYYPLQARRQPGEKLSVIIPSTFVVTDNGMLNILVDMDAERSVIKTGKNKYELNPVLISGTVSSPLDLY